MTPLDYKKKFIEIYRAKIKREGADKLLEFLEDSDFFTAPASTRYHGSHPGGLVEHSINVYECLCDYMARPRVKELYGMNYSEESIAIVSLLHDICKTNFYVETTRNVKEDGVWKTVPYYSIDDKLPYGHGEKSVYMVSAYIKLTRDEAFAIRYHMASPRATTSPTSTMWARPMRCSPSLSPFLWLTWRLLTTLRKWANKLKLFTGI